MRYVGIVAFIALMTLFFIGGEMHWRHYQKACEAAGGHAKISDGSADLWECWQNTGDHDTISIPGFKEEEGGP